MVLWKFLTNGYLHLEGGCKALRVLKRKPAVLEIVYWWILRANQLERFMMTQRNKKLPVWWQVLGIVLLSVGGFSCTESADGPSIPLHKDAHILLIGNNLGSRMMNYGHFETELHLRYPDSMLYIRNMCDGGNTPGFRPHPGRVSPWAFPGAETFQTELAKNSGSRGHFESPDEWLTRHKADIIIAFFGFNSSFRAWTG